VLDRRELDVRPLLASLTPTTAGELEARLPEVDAALARLATSPLPPALDHGDLHGGNVFSRRGEVRILDWGDAAVSHPLLTLTVEEDPAARDRYLAAWEPFAPRERLLQDVEDVVFVRYLVRALNTQRIEPYDPEGTAEGIELRVRLFLDSES
jgi:Phosphotransferase enzyme family